MVLLVTFVISGLFVWTQFGNLASLHPSLAVPLIPGLLAAVTFIIALISYFIAPLPQLGFSTYLNYVLALLSIIVLVVGTDGLHSTYLALFYLALPLASLLGVAGVITAILALAVFTTNQYLGVGLSSGDLMQLSIVGGIAVLAGFLLWSRSERGDAGAADTRADKSYHELASQLSQVAGKSEVVINAIGDGVLALNSHGIVQLINPAAEKLLGWPSHDALNLSYKSVLKLINSKDAPVDDANDPVMLAINTNKAVKNDSFSLQTQSGKNFLASVSVSPVGQPGEGVIVVFRDITSEKSDERQRAEFISTASHEMRTPVASIEGYLGLVLNPKITNIDDKARDYITKAHESAEHLGRLFADLLDVSKADDSRLKNDPKVVDVVPFVRDIVEGLTPKAKEKGLMMLYKPIPDEPTATSERRLTPVYYANVDNDHLREIVQNLVENAIKYTLKGQVTVDIGGDETHVVISIADSGIGIPREDMDHLFQKFYRIDTSETREIGGTGLGLYLCRRLTETIGGRIWVESEYRQGSTFYVEIPRIGHDEATRLIEQASIEAENEVKAEPSQPNIPDAGVPTVDEAMATPAPAPVAAPQAAPTEPAAPITTPPPVQPTVVPQPAPVRTQIVVQTPEESTPVPPPAPPMPAPAPTAANTPLSAIEANPDQFIATRRSQPYLSIPPRG